MARFIRVAGTPAGSRGVMTDEEIWQVAFDLVLA
jgi:hypothetical protein